jgi:hypothetical protein
MRTGVGIVKVLCAWCEAEGRPALLREVEPLDDPAASHGICDDHHRAVLAESKDCKTDTDAA